MPGKLNFSNDSSNYARSFESNFRKAGDAFRVGSNNTSKSKSNARSAYDNWMTFMGSQNTINNSYDTQTNTQNNMAPSSETVSQPVEVSKEQVVPAKAAAPAPKQVSSKSTPHSGSRAAYYATASNYGAKDNTISNLVKNQYGGWLAAGNVSTDPNAPKFN